MKKNLNIILITASIITLVIVTVIIVGFALPTPKETIQGQAEATDYRVSSKIPARVLEIRVKKGDVVSKGDTLVVLDAPDIDAKLSQAQAAEATEKAAKSQYDMAVNGSRHEDLTAAHAQVERARGAIDEVSSYVSETALIASADGVVTDIFPEVGELVGSGAPIMNVSMTDDMWFTFNIREDYLPGVTVGAETDVYVPAFDKTVRVKVTRIKDVGSFATWKATKALDRYDLKTFEVEAYPVNRGELTGLRPGMTAVFEK